jgi:hypothetical protein
MHKLRLVIALLLSTILLTGCVKMDLALEINADKTVSGTLIYAISDALSELGTTSEDTDPTADLFDTSAEGVTVSEYKEDGYTGTKITLDRVPISAFNKQGGESGGFQIIRDENLITLKGELDLSSGDTDDSDISEWGDALAKSLFATADLNISVKFPVKVLSTTGTISEDGRTVSWKPQLGEKVDLTTTVELPNRNLILIGIAAAALLLLIIAFLVVFKVRGRKKSETHESVEEATFTI